MVYFITNEKQIYDKDIQPSTINKLKEYFKDHKEIAFDLETEGFDPYTKSILSAQFGDSYNQFVVDTKYISLNSFKDLMESKIIIAQNAKFDLRFAYHYDVIPTKVYDTYLSEKNLTNGYNNIQRGLDKLVWRYCRADMSKEIRGVIHKEGLSKRVIKYGAKDVEFLHDIKRQQEIKAKEWDLENTLKIDNEFVRVLSYIEYCGIKADRNLLEKKIEQNKNKLKEAKDQLDQFVLNNVPEFTTIDKQYDLFDPSATEPKCKINWSSTHQVIPLFKHLGINTQVTDKDGTIKNSIDSKIIKPQKDKSEIISLYLEYKDAEKTLTTYGENILELINPISGRIHTSFTQIMDTGRLSSGGSQGDGKSLLNIQNIPAPPDEREEGIIYTRDCFVPDNDNYFIICDYSGQESVVFAEKCRDDNLLDFYDNGLGDMHSFVAKKIYPELKDLDLKEIKSKHKDKRQKSKSAGFAIKDSNYCLTRKFQKFVALLSNKKK